MWNTAALRKCWPGGSNAHQVEPGERTVTCASVREGPPTRYAKPYQIRQFLRLVERYALTLEADD